MNAIYDKIGTNYSISRKTDPRIAKQIFAKLEGAKRIVNIGAGTGSYEPEDADLIAVEPSFEMISQRKKGAHRVVQASAEELPFGQNSFTHGMTVLSMHHWKNRVLAFAEINRVVSERFVAVTWNPEHPPFWLTRDYFPEIHEIDKNIFPKKKELEEHFDAVEISPLMIPEDCIDGFLAAFWKRPEAYLTSEVRQAISSFSKIRDTSKGLQKLKSDLETGLWARKNEDLLNSPFLDAGYIIVSARTRNV